MNMKVHDLCGNEHYLSSSENEAWKKIQPSAVSHVAMGL